MTGEDMEEITKEWTTEFLVPVDQAELSNPYLIRSPVVTHEEYDAPSSSRKKKKEEVHELSSASKETTPDSPKGGGGNEVNQEEEGEEDKKEKGEVTTPKDPLTEAEMSKKRKVSP